MKKRFLLVTIAILMLVVLCMPVMTAYADTYVTYEDGYLTVYDHDEYDIPWYEQLMPSEGVIVIAILVSFVTCICLLRWHTKKPSINTYEKYMKGPFVVDYKHVRNRITLNEVVDIFWKNNR